MVLGAAFLSSNLGSSSSGNRTEKFVPFLFLGPPRAVYLSPSRCLTCSLELARCSVGRGISRGARKLARTPALSKKKKNHESTLATVNTMFLSLSLLDYFVMNMTQRIC